MNMLKTIKELIWDTFYASYDANADVIHARPNSHAYYHELGHQQQFQGKHGNLFRLIFGGNALMLFFFLIIILQLPWIALIPITNMIILEIDAERRAWKIKTTKTTTEAPEKITEAVE